MKAIKKQFLFILGLVLLISMSVSSKTDGMASSISCKLTSAQTVAVNASFAQLPATDNGLMYLYELMPYEYSISKSTPVVATVAASAAPSFSFSLYDAAGVSRICRKYAVGVICGGTPVLVSGCRYISNPEIAATHTRAPQQVGFVEPKNKMVLYRIGETNVGAITIDNYSTAVIVNKKDSTLINPNSKGSDAHPVSKKMYYMFNASNAAGVNKLQATMTSFAANTFVDEFIIGNEVNNRMWNYTKSMDWATYVREYAQAFRVAYNAIKSTNANAKVYISIDQMWNMDCAVGTSKYYEYLDGLDFLLYFNNYIVSEGNIDWGLCLHPYPNPLLYAKFWDMSGCANGSYYAAQVAAGQVVTFQNLPIVTSFMAYEGMRNPNGQVRDIILPEVGITQAQGVEVQAAAMMACYQAAKNNPYISRIYFHRMNEGGTANFSTTGISEQVYNALVSGNPGEYNAWALNYIGITDWRQLVAY